ncbi:hypothetical protein N7499_007582 [Penicillium canescens]|uniref:Uncharacterized protein n=1 Tax=Penicillium canescens TaxID=5083 RepID=A0AAD6IGM5_PENCN|nr:uncharacterized protein N7446_003279 [Penicillium canescens]KAJ6045077.1 hypothetical protein N7460_006432 [Penicillium canescens]KAJ6075502.1 hypothetical protein N7446_003279 [Penicillium canescens]KAJ6082708.1 hypothetical protein N7499_007582 [Penicillium canescens]KAJ6175494.1 hypothetical protein N7485_002408 [Penicillium canescens]
MAQTRGERSFSFHNLLKMLLSSNSSTTPAHEEAEMAEDVDEPPDHIMHATHMNSDQIVFARPRVERKESLLTRALKSSPEMSPSDPHTSMHDSYMYRSYPHSNISGISTAELTSDGGLTSPSLSNTPSPPLPPQMMGKAAMMERKDLTPKVKVVDSSETTVEANLGRKRCISFACGRKTDDQPKTPVSPSESQTLPPPKEGPEEEAPIPEIKRRTTLTFVCPGRETISQRTRSPARKNIFQSRCRGSPAPAARKPSVEKSPKQTPTEESASGSTIRTGVPTSGLGKFEESEATRFHEFASSLEEDDEWVIKEPTYTEKITLNDCMKKEIAIRRLGEQAEEEALEEEEDAEDIADDDSTVHDFSSDDGNESDNEAGFAESDESDDDGSDYEFWAPSLAIPEPTIQPTTEPRETRPVTMERRASNISFDSMTDDHSSWLPAPVQRLNARRPSKTKSIKIRPRTPNLPDSTDFVCGTLDEDRPLEAAYKSCLEQRRLSKQIPIPQDIDPSFPTSDPEDNEDIDHSDDDISDLPVATHREETRGRPEGDARNPSPLRSPKRLMSPPPRRAGRTSPKRFKSPPPRVRAKSPTPAKWEFAEDMPVVESPEGLNISHLVQRRPLVRTKSLPRTPNPFFTDMDKDHRWQGIPPWTESPEREHSRTRELHTRGPVDIVEGLEKKRQKRKEKFWRQHCRKAAKEQMGKRPVPGKGAERMKELGLEAAERCRAYGVGQDAQLVLSV